MYQSSSLTARHLSPSRNISTLIYLVYLFRARFDCVKRPCSSLGRLRHSNFVTLRYIHYITLVCEDIVQSGPPEAAMLQYVMHLLAVEDIEGLPPGGGINAKWVFPVVGYSQCHIVHCLKKKVSK